MASSWWSFELIIVFPLSILGYHIFLPSITRFSFLDMLGKWAPILTWITAKMTLTAQGGKYRGISESIWQWCISLRSQAPKIWSTCECLDSRLIPRIKSGQKMGYKWFTLDLKTIPKGKRRERRIVIMEALTVKITRVERKSFTIIN